VLAAQLDAAFFGNLSAPAPAGLGSLTAGTGAGQVQDLAAGTNPTNLDIFEEAISKAGDVGAEVTAFAMNPADVLFFSKLKQATGSNVPLLGSDPAQPRQRTISGVPVFRVPDLPAGTMYALAADRIRTVIRSDARVEVSSHSHFTSDRVAVKGTVRAMVAFAHPQTIVPVRRAAS
jgi:HK97 family phage major capsid protein